MSCHLVFSVNVNVKRGLLSCRLFGSVTYLVQSHMYQKGIGWLGHNEKMMTVRVGQDRRRGFVTKEYTSLSAL